MPGSFQTQAGGVPNSKALPVVRAFAEPVAPFEYPFAIAGVTRNAAGAALPGCTVVALRQPDFSIAAQGVSDASGNYRLDASPSIQHRVDAYLPGSPDVAGSTVNTLVGS